MDWIITYDIASDRHRTAVNRILNQYGIRVLYTVYQITADPGTLDQILDQIRPHITNRDHLLALPNCEHCRQANIGPSIEVFPPAGWITS